MNSKSNLERKPQSHLINILKATRNHHPNFVLFLGAGASRTSGVKLSYEMIEEWRNCCHEMYGSEQECEAYLKSQSWYNTPEEYSVLFELLYDQPSQRREYIETCVCEAEPSWGYIYLVNLLQKSVFNTVFTTNFDDLLNEACYQFSNSLRPIVCAHDSSIRSVRISSKRPKIIKLHGDFLFDNIKNTVSELETLEDNMKNKFKQYASEFGMIVLGYSGNDRSIMDNLNLLLKTETNFPHGIYWCVRKGDEISQNVDRLTRFPKFKLIEIDGFDEFFASIKEALELELQPEMSDPYGSLVARLNSLIGDVKAPEGKNTNSIIDKDIKRIAEKISQLNILNLDEPDKDPHVKFSVGDKFVKLPIPYTLLAQVEERSGNFNEALTYLTKQIAARPTISAFDKAFKLMCKHKLWDFRDDLVSQLQEAKELVESNLDYVSNFGYYLIEAEQYDAASEFYDFVFNVWTTTSRDVEFNYPYFILNKYQIKAHKGEEFNSNEISNLSSLTKDPNLLVGMGANILLKNYDEANKLLKVAVETNLVDRSVYDWHIVKLLKPHIQEDELKELSLVS